MAPDASRSEDMNARASDLGCDPVERVEVFTNIEDVEALWRRAEGAFVGSPYQAHAWYCAWLACVGAQTGEEPLIVAVFGPSGRLIALFPLVKRRMLKKAVVCEFAGRRHSNANMGLYAPEFAACVTKHAMRRILSLVARQSGRIDVFSFRNVPPVWRGQKTWAYCLGGPQSPSSLHATSMAMPFAAWQETRLSSGRRKRLRRNLRYLGRYGAPRLLHCANERDRDRILATTFAQKEKRFDVLGIDNPFAPTQIQSFIRSGASRQSPTGARPAIELFALEVGGRIVATLGAAVSGATCSAMFLSFEDAPELRTASPGDLLVALVIERLCGLGFEHFDLGAGEASYKERYCSETVPLHDFFHGATHAGALIANGMLILTIAKRWLKRHGFDRSLRRLSKILGDRVSVVRNR